MSNNLPTDLAVFNSIQAIKLMVDEQPVALMPIPHKRLGRSVLSLVPRGH